MLPNKASCEFDRVAESSGGCLHDGSGFTLNCGHKMKPRRHLLVVATLFACLDCGATPEGLLGMQELKSGLCKSLVVKARSFFDDRYAICLLQTGRSPRTLLHDALTGASLTLSDALDRYKAVIRTYERDGDTRYVLAETPLLIEAACLGGGSSDSPYKCFWQLSATKLPTDMTFDPRVTELLEDVTAAGLRDGSLFIEATSLRDSGAPYRANEYIVLTLNSGIVTEIRWHDVERVKEFHSRMGWYFEASRVGKSRGRYCKLLTASSFQVQPWPF